MRKIYWPWMIAVFGIFGTAYGTHLVIYHYKNGNGLNVPSLMLLIFGGLALVFSITLYISILIHNKKKNVEPVITKVEEHKKEEELVKEEAKPVVNAKPVEKREYEYTPREKASYSSYSSYASTIYVKQVGYGPILRIEGNRILDMRTNTYYRIENNMVKQEGSGPLFEIRGNQIKNTFGGYLYEISGSNINKVYGGFYASISGNYITLYDLSIKYEMTDSLSRNQLLAVSALLFGKY